MFFKKYRDKPKDHLLNMNKDVLFIHIPKNGGTSIIKNLNIQNTTHITAKEISESSSAKFLKDRFCFCIVRNPYQRFVSLYNYARMEVSYYHDNLNPEKAKYGKHLDYELLKDASPYQCALYLKAGKLKHDLSWNHWSPQYKWIYSENMKCLVDRIYYLEDLSKLREDLLEQFGIKINKTKYNSSEKTFDSDNLDIKTKEIIKEYYSKDFELFYS